MTKTHRSSLQLLCWTIFILMAVPRMNIKLGPIPFYFIDVFLLLTFLYSTRLKIRATYKKSFGAMIGLILFFAMISEIYAITEIKTIVQPLYMMIRTLLAGSLFFSTVRIIQTEEQLIKVVKFAMVGAMVTAALLILSSIPPTRSLTNNYIFSLKLFEPSSESVVDHYSQYYGAMRGRSYVGVSILSGAFLNSIWPVLLFLGRSNKVQGRWKRLLIITSYVLPIAVVMTYSRGAIIALVTVVFGVIILNVGNFRNQFLAIVGLTVFTFLFIGLDSEYFYFRRLEYATQRAIETRGTDHNEAERINAYTEPFEHLMDNPQFALFGKGLSYAKAGATDFKFKKNYADHAVFAKAYYAYGMVAALIYVFLIFGGLFTTLNTILNARSNRQSRFSKVVFASLLGFIPWFMLGHAAVSQPRGAMLMYFVVALIAIQNRFNITNGNRKKLEDTQR